MTPTRITAKNAAAITAKLAAVNGRATTHAFTEYDHIAYVAALAEKAAYALLGSQKATVGATWNRDTLTRPSAPTSRTHTWWFAVTAASTPTVARAGTVTGTGSTTATLMTPPRAVPGHGPDRPARSRQGPIRRWSPQVLPRILPREGRPFTRSKPPYMAAMSTNLE